MDENTIIKAIADHLPSIGDNLAASAIYDALKGVFAGRKQVNAAEAEAAISPVLRLHNINMRAENVIQALLEKGFLSIEGSTIIAGTSMIVGAGPQGVARVGNNSVVGTAKAQMVAGQGAYMEAQNAFVEFTPDGSIVFKTRG